MTVLPEPTPTAPAAGQADRNTAINQAADRMLAALNESIRRQQHTTAVRLDDPTIPSYEDGPQIGDADPVAQPDSRIVPRWALGLAVGSIGVGAGSLGLGCAFWLACKGMSLVIHGLSSITLPGVLAIAIPFAGFATVATAVGGAISKAKKAVPDVQQHIYNGPVRQETRTTNSRSIWNKNINEG